MKKISCFISLLLLISNTLFAQVGINTDNSAPDPSAGLDVKFPDKGILPPRMTIDQRNAIAGPADGLMIFCTDCGANGSLSVYSKGAWRTFTQCNTPSTSPAANSVSWGHITWNWTAVAGASGYKWNTTASYSSATDMGTTTTKTETGISCGTTYTRYVWVYSGCGVSAPVTLTQSTLACLPCGVPITVNHEAGEVAPVNKTTTYGTVTNIPGEETKCWITSNLGSDHQATAVDDGTEASAGWYWQFNHKQGYKNDGSTVTPSWTITSISESSDWTADNDPCNIELGSAWHIPTNTEWRNVDQTGNWINWNGPWGSGLKLHAAGGLDNSDGSLWYRNMLGFYWSSGRYDDTNGIFLYFYSGNCFRSYDVKACGFSVRCVRNN